MLSALKMEIFFLALTCTWFVKDILSYHGVLGTRPASKAIFYSGLLSAVYFYSEVSARSYLRLPLMSQNGFSHICQFISALLIKPSDYRLYYFYTTLLH